MRRPLGLVIALGTILSVHLLATSSSRADTVPTARLPGTPAYQRVYFSQPVLNEPAGTFHVAVSGASAVPSGWSINAWVHTPNVAAAPVNSDMARYTGFYPAGDLRLCQQATSASDGASGIQVQGNEIGVVIDSESLVDSRRQWLNCGGHYPCPMPIIPAVHFASPIAPWADGHTHFAASFDLQVPTSTGGFANQIAVGAYLIDRTTDKTLVLEGLVFDSRGQSAYHIYNAWDALDRVQIVSAPINSGSIFRLNEQSPESASFQETPWTGFRHFTWDLTAADVANAISFANNQGAGLSKDLRNYGITLFNFDSEINFAPENPPARMGYSLRNLRLCGY